MEYKAQYQEYLLQATAALDAASARFLPEVTPSRRNG